MQTQYNDDYTVPTVDIGDGGSLELLQQDKSILQKRRTDMNLTQQQVADAAGIQLRQYQRLESGERTMAGASMRIGLSICDVLKLDPHRFVPHRQL